MALEPRRVSSSEAVASVGDVADLNQLNGLPGPASLGSRLLGWYLQVGYDLLLEPAGGQQLLPYVRYEQINTQQRVPDGFAADPANDRRIVTLGGMWKPLPNISLKADYGIASDEADTGVNQLNVNLGYLF
jgi:hypothetical protein